MKTNSSVEMETVSDVLTNVIMIMTVKTTQTKKDVLVRKFFWVSKNDQTEHFVRSKNNILISHTQFKVQSVIINNYTLKLKACATPRTSEPILLMGSIIWLFLLANGKNHSFRNGVCTCFRAQTSKLKCSICPVRSIFFRQNADFFLQKINKQDSWFIVLLLISWNS